MTFARFQRPFALMKVILFDRPGEKDRSGYACRVGKYVRTHPVSDNATPSAICSVMVESARQVAFRTCMIGVGLGKSGPMRRMCGIAGG